MRKQHDDQTGCAEYLEKSPDVHSMRLSSCRRQLLAKAAIADARSQTSVMVTATDALETALCFRFGNR
jgi:hypothetical protein